MVTIINCLAVTLHDIIVTVILIKLISDFDFIIMETYKLEHVLRLYHSLVDCPSQHIQSSITEMTQEFTNFTELMYLPFL